jgi:hypothetical protein
MLSGFRVCCGDSVRGIAGLCPAGLRGLSLVRHLWRGILRIRHDSCHTGHLAACSYKRRGFCPDCGVCARLQARHQCIQAVIIKSLNRSYQQREHNAKYIYPLDDTTPDHASNVLFFTALARLAPDRCRISASCTTGMPLLLRSVAFPGFRWTCQVRQFRPGWFTKTNTVSW